MRHTSEREDGVSNLWEDWESEGQIYGEVLSMNGFSEPDKWRKRFEGAADKFIE